MKMSIRTFFVIIVVSHLYGCKEPDYAPSAHFKNNQEEVNFIRSTIQYYGKLPKGYTNDRRQDTVLNKHYDQIIQVYLLEAYHIDKKSEYHYFMVSRPAPSLYEKRICIAGKLKYAPDGSFSDYEEVFWTFKFKKEILKEKSMMLFRKMVQGESLEAYLPQNSTEEFIEFPDARNAFDKKSKTWKLRSQIQE